MAVKPRINPSLFDKLVGDTAIAGLSDDEAASAEGIDALRSYSFARLEKFNEEALRNTVRRDLGWLLNTTNLGSVVDLEPYPHVQTSVINFGVPDMAGKATTSRAILQRARDIRKALLSFEPRLDSNSLTVEASDNVEKENAITFVIHGDITSAVNAMPVKLRTDVEIDSATVTVRE